MQLLSVPFTQDTWLLECWIVYLSYYSMLQRSQTCLTSVFKNCSFWKLRMLLMEADSIASFCLYCTHWFSFAIFTELHISSLTLYFESPLVLASWSFFLSSFVFMSFSFFLYFFLPLSLPWRYLTLCFALGIKNGGFMFWCTSNIQKALNVAQ